MKLNKGSQVLVTGGAGFIGSNLTEALLKKGFRVRVLDNFLTGKRENLKIEGDLSSMEIIEGDIRDLAVCRDSMEGVQVVFHLAAIPSVQRSIEDPLTTHSVNIDGTLNILQAAREARVKRLIYASSSSVYGDSPSLPKREDMPPAPLSPYALHKLTGERYCRLFCQLYGLETVSLRYFNIFGPKQDPSSVYSAVIPKFIDALTRKQRPVIFGDGEQSRDFTFVENAVHANLLSASADGLSGEAVNIACGRQTSLNELLAILKRILDSEIAPIYKEFRKGDVKHSLADIVKAKQLIGFAPTVSFEEGLRKTVERFLRKGTV